MIGLYMIVAYYYYCFASNEPFVVILRRRRCGSLFSDDIDICRCDRLIHKKHKT